MKFFLWGRGVIIFDAAKFERRSFCRSGDTARANREFTLPLIVCWRLKTRFFPKLFFFDFWLFLCS